MRRSVALVLLFATTLGAPAAAQDPPLADVELADLMKMEVESVFGASKFLQAVTDAPAAVSVVTARDIVTYGYRTLAEIIRSAPGFNVTNDRNYSYVGVRGFQRPGDYNSRVLILIDGHRLNDPIYNQAYIGTEFVLDVELIERVELIRGPSSSLYGTNAFFAVINVVTKKGKSLRGLHLSGDVGSLRSGRGLAAYGTTFANGLDLMLSGSRYQSEGQRRLYFQEFDDPATNDGVAENLDADANYRTYGSISFKGLSLQALYGSREKRVPTAPYSTQFNDPRFETRDTQGFADLRYARALAGANVSGRLYYDRTDYGGRYPGDVEADGAPGPLYGDLATSGAWGTEINVAKALARHKLTGGVEYRNNFKLRQGSFDVGSGYVYLDDRRRSHDEAVFVEDQFAVTDKLILNAGVRTDRYQGFGTTTNPRLAVIFKPAPKTAVKALWGTAFRAPNAYELYYQSEDLLSYVPNPTLSPETIRTVEIVFERYFVDRYRIMSNVYRSDVRGLISQVELDGGRLQFQNLGAATTRGMEVEVEAKWGAGIASRVAYSLQRARDERTDEPLVNSAAHLATVNLTVPFASQQIFAAMDLHYVGPVRTLNGTSTKGFAVPNLTLTTREFHDRLTLSAHVANLFDNTFAYPAAEEHRQNIIQQDGRTFRVGLTYVWRQGK